MKNHKEMFKALLAGETLEEFNGYYLRLEGGDLLFKNPEGLLAPIANISFRNPQDWRIKPKTININGFEVPEPYNDVLDISSGYYMPSLYGDLYSWVTLIDHPFALNPIKQGLAHKSKSAAILHAKALLSFTRKNND